MSPICSKKVSIVSSDPSSPPSNLNPYCPVNVMKQIVAFVSVVVLCLGAANACAGDLLFEKASRNYNRNGVVGQAYRRELEKRMFSHSAWRQRLYYEAPGAETNETIEIYVRADGSSWLSIRTALPALTPLIRWRPLDSQRTELAKELNRIRIRSCEVELPSQLASKLEHLWKIMLPGVDRRPSLRSFLSIARRLSRLPRKIIR